LKSRKSVKLKNYGPVLAKQEPRAEADINNIVARYFKTGYLPENNKSPKFGDFTGPGFQEMRNAIAEIDMQFMMLPAKIRKMFRNDPYQVIRFVEDPKNAQEAAKLGLIQLLDPDGDPFVPDEPKSPEKPPVKADPEANPRKKTEPEGD